ncbi:hypothetical protein D6779_09130 [Candidatus Parcubacteria bacterium]|nr:MAG: hypothetical protein D6779_09130 [Candidatus Parcubacteria bacterium]
MRSDSDARYYSFLVVVFILIAGFIGFVISMFVSQDELNKKEYAFISWVASNPPTNTPYDVFVDNRDDCHFFTTYSVHRNAIRRKMIVTVNGTPVVYPGFAGDREYNWKTCKDGNNVITVRFVE